MFLAQHQYIETFLKILIFFILKIYGSLASVLYTEHNLKLQAQEVGGGGGIPYEGAGMIVVSLRGVHCRLWKKKKKKSSGTSQFVFEELHL